MSEVTKEQASKAAEKIFLPEPTNIVFLGKTIEMKPVPISLAKELRLLSEQIETSLQELGERPKTTDVIKLDVSAIDFYIAVAQKLLKYYGAEVSLETIEKGANTFEIKEFIRLQMVAQGEEDFLVQKLRYIMRVFFPSMRPPEEEKKMTMTTKEVNSLP